MKKIPTNVIIKKLCSVHGNHVNVVWRRELKTLVGVDKVIEKETSGTFRAGINYENRGEVIASREVGALPSANEGLPWGKWLKFPYIIEHNKKKYVRLYPASFDFPMTVNYFINGKKASKEKAAKFCRASEFKDGGKPLCYVVKADDIKQIG